MKLAALLQHLGQAEVAVERQRQRMARLVDFEPYASFQRVDRECLGYLNCR